VILAADNVPANTDLTVDVLGLPSTLIGRVDPNVLEIIGLVAITLAVILALALGLRPREAGRRAMMSERDALLRAIADLDDHFAAGEVDHERYRTERAERKHLLVDLMLGGSNART
jgi:hypothetical protein